MMANWQRAIDFILAHEGGYVPPSAKDPGGETNFGISKRYHLDLDIKNLTKDEAVAIYNKEYWGACDCTLIHDDNMALAVFDTAVNCGVARARHWYNETRTNVDRFLDLRESYYESLCKSAIYARFKKGWMNRITDLRKNIKSYNNKGDAV